MAEKVREDQDTDLERMRHSTAHIMAQAVQDTFGDVKLGIGPSIADGFYYDFDLPRPLTPDDLDTIQQKMKEIVKRNSHFIRKEVTKEEALQAFNDQPYKIELIEELPEDEISLYQQDGFVDLCRGPHVESTGKIGAFKLLSVAGAYWRGDEKRPMLQRIYGTVFPTQKELDEHLEKLQEAIRRDHRRLGKELDLYNITDEVGPGLVLWHPKGALVRMLVENFWREEHMKRGYQMLFSPHIGKADLWKTSGHLDNYRENMYSPIDIEGQEYILKPMNCPFHILIYKSKLRSYRDLPLRWAELGTVYRYERSGVLHGLTRVRGFTQDDAHIFCRPDQLENEVIAVVEFARFMMETFGFSDYDVYLSTRPEKAVGTLEVWEMATATLANALERMNQPYVVDPGEGVFYGPKIDIKLKDALGRAWQGPTIQVDFNLPERFDVNYIGDDGAEHRTVMVHRVVLGSMERFLGCLIEHFAGAFPVWLAPIQAVIIPIADRHLDFAKKVEQRLTSSGMRVEVDTRSERMNLKIREAQLQKVPYMLVVGDKEEAEGQVAVRLRSGENLGPLNVDDFLSIAQKAIDGRSSTLA